MPSQRRTLSLRLCGGTLSREKSPASSDHAILSLVPRCGEDVGQWQMCDMDPLSTWVRGRAIIIGDAAHPSEWRMRTIPQFILTRTPVLPHQAGGALSAIEDAEALGAFLRNVAPHGVHEALQRVFRVRFKRTAEFQLKSRFSKQAPPAPIEEQLHFWNYSDAARWEFERSDMVLQHGEEAIYSLR